MTNQLSTIDQGVALDQPDGGKSAALTVGQTARRRYSIVGKYCRMNSLGVNTGKVAAEKSFVLRVIIASNPSAVAAACCTASS